MAVPSSTGHRGLMNGLMSMKQFMNHTLWPSQSSELMTGNIKAVKAHGGATPFENPVTFSFVTNL